MGSGTGLNLTDANIDQISHGLSQNEAALFSFGGIPCHMEPSDFLPVFLPKKLEEMLDFASVPTFCTTFLPKMLEEKLYMMWPVKTDLPSEFSRVKSRALSRAVSSVLISGACICSNFNTVKNSSN